MAKIDFSLIEKQMGQKIHVNDEPTDEEWWETLNKRDGEDELERCNRVAVTLVKAITRHNCHGKTEEEFVEYYESFKKEFDNAIKNNPIIGDK